VPVGGTAIVRATENVDMVGNLDSDEFQYSVGPPEAGGIVQRTIRVYDSLGAARDIQLTFTKTANNNEWAWVAEYDNGGGLAALTTGSGNIQFDAYGQVQTGGTGTIEITNAELGALDAYPVDPFSFTIDFSAMTQLAAESDVTMSNQDGFPRGVLESFNIGSDGVINGVFTNGLTRVLGQVALASFANDGGLSRFGDNLFIDTASSGSPRVGLPNTGGRGQVSGGVLEGSNVDLGREFSNMIVTQRGFQANARTISASDTLLQETVNLVR